MANYNYLIVSSGLFGATFAYKAKQTGRRLPVRMIFDNNYF